MVVMHMTKRIAYKPISTLWSGGGSGANYDNISHAMPCIYEPTPYFSCEQNLWLVTEVWDMDKIRFFKMVDYGFWMCLMSFTKQKYHVWKIFLSN